LGRKVFPELFERTCGPVAGAAGVTAREAALGTARGSFLRSWRLLAIDGFEVDVPDSKCPAVGNAVMVTPISAMSSRAERTAMPVISSNFWTASEYG